MNHTNHTASIVFPFPKSCEAAWEGQQPLMTHMLKLQMWLGSTWRRQAPPLLYTGMTGIPCIVVAALASAMPAHIAQLDIYELCGEGEVYSSGGACLRHACLPPPCPHTSLSWIFTNYVGKEKCIVVAALASAMRACLRHACLPPPCPHTSLSWIFTNYVGKEKCIVVAALASAMRACLRHACLPPPCVLASAMPAHIAQLDVYEKCG